MDELIEVLKEAIDARASDVYLLPKREGFVLAWRLPARYVVQNTLHFDAGQRWLNYLKYLAGMDVAEHRRVQIGLIAEEALKLGVTLRLSSVADYSGRETLVIRLLYGVPALDRYTKPLVARLTQAVRLGGMIALSGSTGSGKTTLLYQTAKELAKSQMVMTIEDPVEILEPDFLQLQVNQEAGMTYASLLKAALRHRPDVLVIGEIRDRETAEQACNAAISGHAVLATVHASSAELISLRLQSLGVSPTLVDAALRLGGFLHLVHSPVTHPEVIFATYEEGV